MSSPNDDEARIGRCRLCLIDQQNLQSSHYLPSAIYKTCRDASEANPNPFLITKEKALQTSTQFRRHLLCQECEQRLHKNGEDWVLRHCLRSDGRFKLAEILAAETPSASDDRGRIYLSAEIPQIDVPDLVYFASSVFWRGAVCPWAGSYPVILGPYEEHIRQYLMGQIEFPKCCALTTIVREGDEINRTTLFPHGHRFESFRIHKFMMPGLAFTLAAGSRISHEFRAQCVIRGFANPIFVSSVVEAAILRNLTRLAAAHNE
jgi:hypothetical protein